MLRIGICDDVKAEVEWQERLIYEIIKDMGINIAVSKCYSGNELLIEIELKGHFDIILIDIELGDMNGIEVARKIREKDSFVELIFITSFEQYSKEAISVHPFAFIDKPISYDRMHCVIKEAVNGLLENECFNFDYDKIHYCVNLKSIKYFLSEKRLVYIICQNKTHKFYGTINDIEKQLSKSRYLFYRIHHSFLVNSN